MRPLPQRSAPRRQLGLHLDGYVVAALGFGLAVAFGAGVLLGWFAF